MFFAAGFNINMEPELAFKCYEATGMTFLFAQKYHTAMKNAAPVRKELGIKTIFNILGPLTNPGNIKGQMLGIFDGDLTHSVAEVLLKLGRERAIVVHGEDGLDEITTTGSTSVSEVRNGIVIDYIIHPLDYGIPLCMAGEIIGGDTVKNAAIIKGIFKGKQGAGISNIMDTVKEIRKLSSVPLLYLVYYNCIFRYGIEKFMSECEASGIDGLIIPDLPLEERSELSALADHSNVYLIPMVAPTSEERIEKIVRNGKGFVYCVSVAGVTGVRDKIDTDIKAYMDTVGTYSPIPKIIGFGISSAEMARNFKDMCDGVVVGSAIIKKIAEQPNLEVAIDVLSSFVRELKEGLG